MPRFYHVTMMNYVKNIRSSEFQPSNGVVAGGISVDTAAAYQCVADGEDLNYFEPDGDFIDKSQNPPSLMP